MPVPRAADYLQPDEAVMAQTNRHRLSAVDGFLGILLAWIVVTVGGAIAANVVPVEIAATVWTLVVMATFGAAWGFLLLHWRRSTSLFTVTDQRVYLAYGRIRFHLLQTTFDKITDLHVRQSLFGRIWGYGTINVQTAGTGITLAGVQAPLDYKRTIEDQRSRFLRSLIGEQRKTARPRKTASAAKPMWQGSPSRASFIAGLLQPAIVLTAAIVLFFVGLFAFEQAMVAAGGAALLGLATAWYQWILFRYTSYEVTSRGVVVKRGWLSRRRVEATFAKVTDVGVVQELLGRLLGYGRITINTAGANEAPVVFSGIATPDDVKQIIDKARGEA